MNSFKERLSFLFGKQTGPTKIAKEIGMTFQGFTRIWYDNGIPKSETLIKIWEITGCSLTWLLTGTGQPYCNENQNQSINTTPDDKKIYDINGQPIDVDEFVFIPQYTIPTTTVYDCYHKNTATIAFRRQWIENYLHVNPKDLSVIAVSGDSMKEIFNDGDNILINHMKNAPNDGLYALRLGDKLIVKRTQLLPNNELLITSDNEVYKPFKINLLTHSADITIIGKVEWSGKQL